MPVRERYASGTPSWVELTTTDVGAAKAFYTGLFDWSFEEVPTGDEGTYSLATLRGHRTAGLASQPPDQATLGVPPHWMLYITVDDVDAAAARVAPAGGSVHAGPFDVMDAGRMVVIQDSLGVYLGLWQARQSIGCELVNEPGAFTWEELIAPGAASAAPFYEAVVGLRYVEVPMEGGSTYGGLSLDGTSDSVVGGLMEPPMPGIPPHWSIYFGCADVDATTAEVKELGGSVMVEPFDIPVGRMSVVADPQGAVFNLFQMPEPEAA